MTDEFDLDRFVRAQDPVIEQARRELLDGRKRTHWMWFIFPQLAGLGRSSMAQRFAIGSLAEADAFRRHSILGPRLVDCTGLVKHIKERTVHDIFGSPDDMKFHSCVTLFAHVRGAEPVFATALEKYFAGEPDQATLKLLNESSSP